MDNEDTEFLFQTEHRTPRPRPEFILRGQHPGQQIGLALDRAVQGRDLCVGDHLDAPRLSGFQSAGIITLE